MGNELLRHEALKARRAMDTEKRQRLSATICAELEGLEAYQAAETVMIYKATGSEVDLSTLRGKRFAYPLCKDDGNMIALMPKDSQSFKTGYGGIKEPISELSKLIAPEDIDLVICPCAAFDSQCNRLGMGKGFYDRFLPKCPNARFIAVAFEAQRVEGIIPEAWDVAMDMVVTEKSITRKRK